MSMGSAKKKRKEPKGKGVEGCASSSTGGKPQVWEENPGLYHALTCGPPVALLSYIMPMRAITTYFALWGLIRMYVPLPRALEVLSLIHI